MIPVQIFEQSIYKYFQCLIPVLTDPKVSEVMINGPNDIWVEVAGRLHKTDIVFPNPDDLLAGVKNIAQFVGRPLGEMTPQLDARLPDGSRVHVIVPPCAQNGITVAIRRFQKNTFNINTLLEKGSLTPEGMKMLEDAVAQHKNIIVAGGTGSGKTSLLNCISGLISPNERIIVIEDAAELQLQQPHVVSLETRPPDNKGRGRVTIRDLFKSALRLRPDRVVIGEIRGEEALDLIQAMTSGHRGSMSTIHATYPEDTLRRLETLAMMADIKMPLSALRAQILSAIDLIVQTNRLSDGTRRVTHIVDPATLDYH